VLQQVLSDAIFLAFAALGLAAFIDWLRHRDRAHAYLALAVGSLGIVAALGQVAQFVPGRTRLVVTDLNLAVFLFSGYALLLFRSEFIPVRRRTLQVAAAAVIAIGLFYFAASAPLARPSPRWLLPAATIAIGAAWSVCVTEPAVRFWLASRGRPRVQRIRLRALSGAYLGLVAIVVFASLGGPLAQRPEVQVFTQLVALALTPLLFVSFSPPRWVRRLWRTPEEDELRQAYRDLVLFSPDRKVLAERALDWALRLVGGEAGVISDGARRVLATEGVTKKSAQDLLNELQTLDRPMLVPVVNHQPRRTAVAVPLNLEEGLGSLLVLSGPFTPVFGTDEVDRLGLWATAITAGLDRVMLTERITALEQSKSQFLNLASHELRGPITVIRGYLSMAESGSLGKLSSELQQVLPLLISRADEMNALVEQMIEAARLEEGRLELHPEQTDLREIAKRALEQVRPLADSKHQLVIDSPEEQVNVVVDPERVATIVSNLLSNAIKYSPAGGEVRCSVYRESRMAKVRVSDRGVGIASRDMPRLFTRFGRINNKATNHIPGTGLGLYLSRELARMHGGDLTVESVPGKGSTFTLMVPAK
jgi:signal transduction histidine kinase